MKHQARKRFGQNFLHDQRILSDIISYIQLNPGEHWLEIGPGLGALTQPLLSHDIKLTVIELDRDLVSFLNKKFADSERFTIHSADALTFDLNSIIDGQEKIRIIGNLPYNISTPLLFHLLNFAAHIQDMHFMLQKEVVDRICADPGSKTYGRLSVMIQYHCRADFLFEVPPESFNPPPKVTSAIVKLSPHSTPPFPASSLEMLNAVVSKAFSQRRKTIRNSLRDFLSEQQLSDLDINPGLRAESLSLQEFVSISNHASFLQTE